MLEAKRHIADLYRVKNSAQSRAGYLRLDKNENIVPWPKAITARLQKEIQPEFFTRYPEVQSLYTKLAKHLKCSEDNLFLTAGSDAAIKAVFEAFVNPLDSVVLLSPSYAMFYVYAKMFQANLVEVFHNNDLSVPVDQLKEKISAFRPKLVCIANPNSPIGTIIKEADLKSIIEVCKAAGSIILVDEAYYLYYPKTCASLIKSYTNLVVTRTFSKAFGLASARLGFALGSKEMIDVLSKTRPMYEINAYAVKFAEIMLDNYPSVLKNLKEAEKGKKYLETQLSKFGYRYFKSHTNFVLIDTGSKENAKKVTEALFKRKIIVKSDFGFPPIAACIRINTGSVLQMKQFLKEFRKIYSKKD